MVDRAFSGTLCLPYFGDVRCYAGWGSAHLVWCGGLDDLRFQLRATPGEFADPSAGSGNSQMEISSILQSWLALLMLSRVLCGRLGGIC